MSTGPNYEAYHIDPGSPATPAPAGSDAQPSGPQGQPTPSTPPASDLPKPHQPSFASPYQAFGTRPAGPPPPQQPAAQPPSPRSPASQQPGPPPPGWQSQAPGPQAAHQSAPYATPYQQPYPPRAGYQPPAYQPANAQPLAPYPVRPSHPKGMTVLVLGIISVVLAPICGPFAWSMGRKTLREIDAAPMAYSNRSEVSVGMILGIVGTVVLILTVAVLLFYVLVIIGIAASTY